MSTQSTLIKINLAVVLLGAIYFGNSYLSNAAENKTAADAKTPVPAAPLPPGTLKFATNAAQLSSLKIATVEEIALPVSDMLNGRVAYDESVTARVSSPVSGRVTALHAELGDNVHAGSVLADIDSPDLGTAEADWHKALSDETRKKLAYERAKTLFDAEVLARKDYESADTDYLQSKAETKRAHARIRGLNASGNEDGHFGLKSPLAGTVADKQINPGMEIRPDLAAPLFIITDLHRLWVMVDVPEASIGEIHAGQLVNLETDAYPQHIFTGVVRLVGVALDPLTRRMQVRCSVNNDDGKLKPEMFVRVSFAADDVVKKAIRLPNTSIFIDGTHSYVFVETQPATFVKRRVSVKVKGYEQSYIDSGLSKGERVVTEGAFLLNAEVASNAH